jgi:hypothetical protein
MTRIQINRAPVMTLWAAVVAERLGHSRDEALTLGRAVAGMNAQSKAVRLGLREPAEPGEKGKRAAASEAGRVALLGRLVPVVKTAKGLRAAKDGKADSPEAVERYLESKFGDSLAEARSAMKALAAVFTRDELAAKAYALYEKFRPAVPAGTTGWGAKGTLDLGALARLAPAKSKRG